ncbi:cation:proton antiporter [Blastochloris sulfoviridis]|uniref:Potassium transporter TrkA n=1 Tax=Blastochloris sulfoviridis TaxID=50712 RepID=A0A5M6I3J9_9HYPH|nr:cation:proton antiporter [Blastochloris sulfoviridis]KAA5602790.1 potassium transporter TrkA [Blastochloris sulfoviridis]
MPSPLDTGFYREALVFLGTAGVVIPLMARMRVSPVLGFLVAGLVLGPHSLGRLAESVPWLGYIAITSHDTVDQLAELGVVFLLFTIGLELSFDRLWTMRRMVFGFGMLQVALTTAAIGATAWTFGNPFDASLVIGACLALSSTAIVLQLLAEQRRLASVAGRVIFAVLLAQDLAVVPILFLVVVFSKAAPDGAVAALAGQSVLLGLMLALLQGAAAVTIIVGFGRAILRPFFRLVARTHNRELFMAAILFVVVGTSLLTHFAGLSMALGAFLAGLLLSETEFRREVEVDIEPFKGMLLGLFFISVGMRIDPLGVAREPLLLGLSILGMVFLKVAVVGGLARLFRLSWPVAVEASLLLAGGGEFAFLVLGLAGSGGLLPADIEQFMLLVASGTMMLTPFLARLGRQAGRQARRAAAMADGHGEPAPAEVGRTIVVGYGRVGRLVCELIEGEGRAFIATDRNADIVASGRKAGEPVVYGDATRREFLRKCGLADAPAVVVTMDDPIAAEHVVAAVRAERTDVPVVARARDAAHAARLFRLGATDVVPEALEASLDLASAALQTLGGSRDEVHETIRAKRELLKAPLRAGRPAE